MTLEEEFIELVKSTPRVTDPEFEWSWKMDLGEPYWASRAAFNDFNRCIEEPGRDEDFPEGVLGIYCDDDFFVFAALPLKFRDLPLPTIVKHLWPENYENAVYKPDHDDTEAWTAYQNEVRRRIDALGNNERFVDFSWPIQDS